MCGHIFLIDSRRTPQVYMGVIVSQTPIGVTNSHIFLQHRGCHKYCAQSTVFFFTSLHFPINRKDSWGTIDYFLTSSLHVSLFSTALWESANSILVHSLMLSSHIFFCLPLRLPHLTVPCKKIYARPDGRDT